MAKRSKYGNLPCFVDGRRFASRRERDAFLKLDALQKGGVVRELRTQVPYPLVVNGMTVCTYVADFVFYDTELQKEVVADAKGMRTDVYKIKKKLMRAVHNIDILEL